MSSERNMGRGGKKSQTDFSSFHIKRAEGEKSNFHSGVEMGESTSGKIEKGIKSCVTL
jgi:hypothetical protein